MDLIPKQMFSAAPHGDLPRGVYVERFTVNGHRWVFSVDSNGEQVRLRTALAPDVQATADELWDDLDKVDPIQVSALPAHPFGHLRLI